MNAWYQRWGRLWTTCVGWDRGTELVVSGDRWCLMIHGNRYSDWFGGDDGQ